MTSKTKCTKSYFMLFVTLITSSLFIGNANAAAVGDHCVAVADTGNKKSAVVQQKECYASFSAAMSAATDGTVQLPFSAVPSDIKPESIASNTSGRTVLGIMYSRSKYRGSSLIHVGYYGGCNRASYSNGWIGKWFNDRASSMRVFASCKAVIYEHSYFRGASLRVPYSKRRLGIMNNETSSVKFGRNL